MLASISPLGERARGARWWRTTLSFTAAAVVGGGALGALVGEVGARLDGVRILVAVAALMAVVGAVLDLTSRVPTRRRQVDENWLIRYRDWVYGGGYGFQLGFGASTIVTSAATYLTWVLELASGGAVAGALIGGAFGLLRGLPLLAMAGVNDAPTLRRRNARIASVEPLARHVAAAAQLVAALGLAAVAVTAG